MKTRKLILTSLFTALTAAGAFVKIPVPPAPITLQTLFTAFSGILLGPALGAASQLVYVLLGLIGLPIFTMGGGLSYVLQPSFGFLIGMAPAAYITGKLSDRLGGGFFPTAVSCIAGYAALYAIGLPYLYVVLHFVSGSGITIRQAVWSGAVLYLPGDLAKAALISLAAPRVLSALKRQGLAPRS